MLSIFERQIEKHYAYKEICTLQSGAHVLSAHVQ